MRADLRALLDHDDAELGVELLQADRGGEPGGPGADDHDVEFHRLAGGQFALVPSWRARTRSLARKIALGARLMARASVCATA